MIFVADWTYLRLKITKKLFFIIDLCRWLNIKVEKCFCFRRERVMLMNQSFPQSLFPRHLAFVVAKEEESANHAKTIYADNSFLSQEKRTQSQQLIL